MVLTSTCNKRSATGATLKSTRSFELDEVDARVSASGNWELATMRRGKPIPHRSKRLEGDIVSSHILMFLSRAFLRSRVAVFLLSTLGHNNAATVTVEGRHAMARIKEPSKT